MPELPEVETTRLGISPHILDQRITAVCIRQPQLRWPIPRSIESDLPGVLITSVKRRGKYLLLETAKGTLLIHLGMSGSLRIAPKETAAAKHDHIDIEFEKQVLRLTDPRRFGAVLFTQEAPDQHHLLHHLGPEPLLDDFNGQHLYQKSRNRRCAIKTFIMDSKIVVGVGNIYATESLFNAGIHPERAAGKISKKRYDDLANQIKQVLTAAIKQGGTTLKDFKKSDGKPGYFQQQLRVYGRADLPCVECQTPLSMSRIGQRTTVFCRHCQR